MSAVCQMDEGKAAKWDERLVEREARAASSTAVG